MTAMAITIFFSVPPPVGRFPLQNVRLEIPPRSVARQSFRSADWNGLSGEASFRGVQDAALDVDFPLPAILEWYVQPRGDVKAR